MKKLSAQFKVFFWSLCEFLPYLSPEQIEYLCSEKLLMPLALIYALILGRLFTDL